MKLECEDSAGRGVVGIGVESFGGQDTVHIVANVVCLGDDTDLVPFTLTDSGLMLFSGDAFAQ